MRARCTPLASLLMLMITACGEDATPPAADGTPWTLREPAQTTAPAPGAHDARFVGRWVVHDNVPRGGITADIYTFGAGGEVVREARFDAASVLVQCAPNANTRSCREAPRVRCDFGSSWRSQGPLLLFITLACEDGQTREALLTWPAPEAATDAVWPGTYATLLRVDDVALGWRSATFLGLGEGFMFMRCDDDPARCPLP